MVSWQGRRPWVQLGVILCSTTVLNQSPNDSRFVFNAACGEDYPVLNIRLDDLRPVLQRLAREGAVRNDYGLLPLGVGKCVQFAIGGDKPWILTVLGRRNMNHTYFSPSCKCTRENISCLTCEGGQDDHFSIDQDQMCRDSHVCPNMWLRGGEFVPFVCGCCGKCFNSEAGVEAEEDDVLAMEEDVFERWNDTFSHGHSGRFWNSGPLLPAKWVWSDPLHLFLNLSNVGFDEAVDFFLQHEYVSAESKVLIAQCDAVASQVNQVLSHAHICARFGTDERKVFCGNDLRELMQHASALPDILALLRPLYQRMEPCSFAADAAKARKAQEKAKERLTKEQEAGGEKKKKAVRVDADCFNDTAGISAAAAKRVRKQQAVLQVAIETTRTYQEQFDAHVQSIQNGIDGNYAWKVVNMLNGLVEFYEFVHAKEWLADALAADATAPQGNGVVGWGLGRGPAVTAAVQKRRGECAERSLALAKGILGTVGTAREQTYVHDLVYGLHRVLDVVLHPLLAGMQGVEHVNKQMKLCLVSQCTAANNNRMDADGKRMLGDVAQAAIAKVVRTHVVETRGDSCPQNVYGQRLLGHMSWGSAESRERVAKRDHKQFSAGSASGLQALNAGTHSPLPPTAVASPESLTAMLENASRKRRFTVRGQTPLRPDFIEPEPRHGQK